jgi:hypothetical protein
MVSNFLLLSAMTGFILLIRWFIKVDVLNQFSIHDGLFGIRRPEGGEPGREGEPGKGDAEADARANRTTRLRGRRGAAGGEPEGRPRPR